MVSLKKINNYLFCIALLSINFPIKVYPFIFLLTSFSFLFEAKKIFPKKWMGALLIYALYALLIFFITGEFDELRMLNFYKILINFFFLYAAMIWLENRDVKKLLTLTDYTLHITFVLVLAQLLLYHKLTGFQYIMGGDTSNDGNSIYDSSKFFWGLDNKNLFGARIATLGFPYILLGLKLRNRISIFRISFVIFLAFISMSRTPILALLIGIFLLMWHIPKRALKVSIVFFVLVSLPYILNKALRINNITDTDDGMGVRLVYWGTFFKNFTEISIFGEGFQASSKFLPKFSPIYTGEPNIHNTFLNNYLDFGIIGLVAYVLFLYHFYKNCFGRFENRLFWAIAFAPLLCVMMLLFPGYDNDIIIYLILIFLIGKAGFFEKNKLNLGL